MILSTDTRHGLDQLVDQHRKTYGALAHEYYNKSSARLDFNRALMSRFAQCIQPGGSVLDVGCAVGLEMAILRDFGFSVVGLDASAEMVRLAKQRNPGSVVIEGDFLKLQFARKFEAIVAQAFIHLFPKVAVGRVLCKMRSLLTDGGVVHLTTSKHLQSTEEWSVKADYSGNHWRFRRRWTLDDLGVELLKAGFEVVQYRELTDPFDKDWMVFTLSKPRTQETQPLDATVHATFGSFRTLLAQYRPPRYQPAPIVR